MAVGGTIQSFSIASDYQTTDGKIVFQYQLPPPTSLFSTFIVAVADSAGNGNSSQVLPIHTDGDSNNNCAAFAGANGFSYAGDSESGRITDREQCGYVRFYPVQPPFRGTGPFSISWVPLGAKPITVSIPASAQSNDSYFIYEAPVPVAEGTPLYQFLSDSTGGGSGGGSNVYTVAPSSNTSCLQSGYDLANEVTNQVLPQGMLTAVYQNLAGAVDPATVTTSSSGSGSSGSSSGGGGTSIGGLVGGIIGAVIGVGVILLGIFMFFIYRRRQRRKRDAARKEAPQFVDLDDDEEAGHDTGTGARGDRRGVSQRYDVSPFTYQQAGDHSPEQRGNEVMEMYNDSSNSLVNPQRPNSSRPASVSYAGVGMYSDNPSSRYPPNSSSNRLAPMMGGAAGSYAGRDTNATSTSGSEAESQRFNGAPNAPYVLRTRNDSNGGTTAGAGLGLGSGGNVSEAAPLPRKAALFGEGAAGSEMDENASRRWLQHSDAGPMNNPPASSDVEELPPTYGQWSTPQRQQHEREVAAAAAAASRNNSTNAPAAGQTGQEAAEENSVTSEVTQGQSQR